MSPQTLEEIFVERDDVADELAAELIESATNPTKSQTLLIGPRGIGKTHLVALLYHRVRANKKASGNFRIAWLREDEYGVVSWLDFLLRIFRSLEEEYPNTTPEAELQTLYEKPALTAEREAEKLLLDYLEGRTLLLLVENLNSIFEEIKEQGQRKWRAFMQENAVVCTLATSPTLFSGVSGRNAPFYGFFRIEPLEPLDVEGAIRLLKRIALYREDKELAEFIESPTGHARVRAIHHLAGGSFRIYVIFASFLHRDSLDELVTPFLQLLDELTPYYQGHLAQLSTQQRKIVEVLCDYRGALTVKDLARRGFMSQQTASSQLLDLKERGYVSVAEVRGRETFYELREPLLRLCLEVKKQRGEPVALLIEFLRLWYRREELQQRLELCAPEDELSRQYWQLALEKAIYEGNDPHIEACLRDFNTANSNEDYEKALLITEEMIALRGEALDWVANGLSLSLLKRHKESLVSLDRAVSIKPDYALAWYSRATILLNMGNLEEALESVNLALSFSLEPHFFHAKGIVLSLLGQKAEALQSLNQALKIDPKNSELLLRKGKLQNELSLYGSAIKTFRVLEKRGFKPVEVWDGLAKALYESERHEESITYFQQLIEARPETRRYYVGLSFAANTSTNYELSLQASEKAVALGEKSPSILFVYAQSLLISERLEEALPLLSQALSEFKDEDMLFHSHTRSLLESLYWAFIRKPEPGIWIKSWLEIVQLYERFNFISVLAFGLHRFTSVIAALVIEDRAGTERDSSNPVQSHAIQAKLWADSWVVIGKNIPAFQSVARLFQVTILIAISGDDRSLFELPVEERGLARNILEDAGFYKSETKPKKSTSRRKKSD